MDNVLSNTEIPEKTNLVRFYAFDANRIERKIIYGSIIAVYQSKAE